MIGQLIGRIAECSPEGVVLDVGGVGYQLQIPLSTFYVLSSTREEKIKLLVHTHVREDALQLFGFATAEERQVFERLITISGVGPRLGLAILSGIGVTDLRHAVLAQDRARLQKIPGVGKKTAERLLLELRDKLDLAGLVQGGPLPEGPGTRPGLRGDAVSALVNLGYPENVASRAVDQALERVGPDPDLEALLRAALGRIVG